MSDGDENNESSPDSKEEHKYLEAEVQTNVIVFPHLLDDENDVAFVYKDVSCQTSITALPDSSIGEIINALRSNLKHSVSISPATSQPLPPVPGVPTNSEGNKLEPIEELTESVVQVTELTDTAPTDLGEGELTEDVEDHCIRTTICKDESFEEKIRRMLKLAVEVFECEITAFFEQMFDTESKKDQPSICDQMKALADKGFLMALQSPPPQPCLYEEPRPPEKPLCDSEKWKRAVEKIEEVCGLCNEEGEKDAKYFLEKILDQIRYEDEEDICNKRNILKAKGEFDHDMKGTISTTCPRELDGIFKSERICPSGDGERRRECTCMDDPIAEPSRNRSTCTCEKSSPSRIPRPLNSKYKQKSCSALNQKHSTVSLKAPYSGRHTRETCTDDAQQHLIPVPIRSNQRVVLSFNLAPSQPPPKDSCYSQPQEVDSNKYLHVPPTPKMRNIQIGVGDFDGADVGEIENLPCPLPIQEFVYQHEIGYVESYIDSIGTSAIGCQTEKDEIENWDEDEEEEDIDQTCVCDPWKKYAIPQFGTYLLKRKKDAKKLSLDNEQQDEAKSQPSPSPEIPSEEPKTAAEPRTTSENHVPLYDPKYLRWTEPYMEPLLQIFPMKYEGDISCQEMEILWEDILLPQRFRIKQSNPVICTCPGKREFRIYAGKENKLPLSANTTVKGKSSTMNISPNVDCNDFRNLCKLCKKKQKRKRTTCSKSTSDTSVKLLKFTKSNEIDGEWQKPQSCGNTVKNKFDTKGCLRQLKFKCGADTSGNRDHYSQRNYSRVKAGGSNERKRFIPYFCDKSTSTSRNVALTIECSSCENSHRDHVGFSRSRGGACIKDDNLSSSVVTKRRHVSVKSQDDVHFFKKTIGCRSHREICGYNQHFDYQSEPEEDTESISDSSYSPSTREQGFQSNALECGAMKDSSTCSVDKASVGCVVPARVDKNPSFNDSKDYIGSSKILCSKQSNGTKTTAIYRSCSSIDSSMVLIFDCKPGKCKTNNVSVQNTNGIFESCLKHPKSNSNATEEIDVANRRKGSFDSFLNRFDSVSCDIQQDNEIEMMKGTEKKDVGKSDSELISKQISFTTCDSTNYSKITQVSNIDKENTVQVSNTNKMTSDSFDYNLYSLNKEECSACALNIIKTGKMNKIVETVHEPFHCNKYAFNKDRALQITEIESESEIRKYKKPELIPKRPEHVYALKQDTEVQVFETGGRNQFKKYKTSEPISDQSNSTTDTGNENRKRKKTSKKVLCSAIKLVKEVQLQKTDVHNEIKETKKVNSAKLETFNKKYQDSSSKSASKVSRDFLKNDRSSISVASTKSPVVAALSAFEQEIKPLRQTLYQLRKRIYALDLPNLTTTSSQRRVHTSQTTKKRMCTLKRSSLTIDSGSSKLKITIKKTDADKDSIF